MKYNSVLNRYIFAEIFQPFILNIGFFSFIFLLFQMLEIIGMIVNYRISLVTVFQLIVYSMPYFLVFVFPMSAMLSVLLTIMRMSNDNELIALRAGGVSMYALVPPVMGFCLIAAVLTAVMSVWAMPWGMFQFKHTAFRLATSNLEIGIKERTFNDSFKDVMLYVNHIDLKTKTFTDVFIEDRRAAKVSVTVVAPKGKLISDPETGIFHLLLFDGTVNQVDLEKRSVNAIRFDKYQVSLDARKAVSSAKNFQKGPKEMSIEELSRYIGYLKYAKNTEYYLALLDFHKRFSVPFACFALGFLAIPLGIRAKSARKSFGLGLGLGFFLLYYMMLSAGLVFGEAGVYPPLIGMWTPNIVTAVIGVWLFDKTDRDRPIQFRLQRFWQNNRIKKRCIFW